MRLISIPFLIVLLAPQYPICKALNPIDFTSSSLTLYQFTEAMVNKYVYASQTMDETLSLIQDLNKNLLYSTGKILSTLIDLPEQYILMKQKSRLQEDISTIGFIFKNAIEKKKNILWNKPDHPEQYILFREHYGTDITDCLDRIYNDVVLSPNISISMQLHDSVCNTGMSHMQLYDTLLSRLKLMYTQVYLTKCLMLDFVEQFGNENLSGSKQSGITRTRENLYDRLRNDYKDMLASFQRTMPSASREFYKCGLEVHEDAIHRIDLRRYQLNPFNKKVMTGARLVVKNNILFIQIEEGDIFENGAINSATVDWKSIDEDVGGEYLTQEIQKEQIERISLTELTIPDDEVLVGLYFVSKYDFTKNHYTIQLQMVSRRLAYVEGNLWRENYHFNDTPVAERKMDLSNYNKSKPLAESKNDEYVSLLDGNNKIINTQALGADVIPTPRQGLSGAGLMFKGNDWQGGFLSLKLFTSNAARNLKEDDLELPPSNTILLKGPKDCQD